MFIDSALLRFMPCSRVVELGLPPAHLIAHTGDAFVIPRATGNIRDLPEIVFEIEQLGRPNPGANDRRYKCGPIPHQPIQMRCDDIRVAQRIDGVALETVRKDQGYVGR